MRTPKTKTICKECEWHGFSGEVLVADSPFESGVEIYGCPTCKGVDCFLVACDEHGCWEPVTCGTPMPGGFRNTCSKHRPRDAS